MNIKWLQHACFLLTAENGTRVLTDPPHEYTGYKPGKTAADIVTMSHQHKDHCDIQMAEGKFIAIDKPGKYSYKNIQVNGIHTFHDEFEGSKRGNNIIFVFDIDGLRVCHCGDLGHQLSVKQLEEIGKVDILLVPVGSVYTIDYAGAIKVMESLKPKVTIAMHFKTQALTFELDTPDKFVELTGARRLSVDNIEICKDTIGEIPSVILLNYK